MDAQRLSVLRDFGLSEYAARAYLALLELGTTEARDVSRLARVPIAKIYSTLEQLQMRGLVIAYPGSPKRFEPAPFREFLGKLRQKHLSEIAALEASEEQLVSLFPVRPTGTDVDDRGTVTTLRGRTNVVSAFRDLVGRAERTLVLQAADGFAHRARAVGLLLRGACDRGVEVHVLVPPVVPARVLEHLPPDIEVRRRGEMPGAGANVEVLLADEAACLMTHLVPDDGSETRGEDFALLATEAGIVRALAGTLSTVWLDAPGVLEATWGEDTVTTTALR